MIIFKKLNIRHKTIFIKNVLKNNKTFFMKKKKWQTIIIKMKSLKIYIFKKKNVKILIRKNKKRILN
jgi:hypothetical protein